MMASRSGMNIILGCLLLTLSCNQSEEVENKISMFRGNSQHTGVYETKAAYRFKGVKWLFKTEGIIRSTPTLANGLVYFGSGDGYLYAVDVQSGQEKWRFETGGAVQSTPAVANGTVYFTSRDRNLYAVDSQSGELKWKFGAGETLDYEMGWDTYLSSPLIANNSLYFGGGDGHVYALGINAGQEKWRFDTGARVRSSPAIHNGVLYFGNVDGKLFAVDSETGRQTWVFETEGASLNSKQIGFDRTAIISSPAIADGLIIFGGRDGFLYGLDLENGREQWRYDHKVSWVISSPAIDNGIVYTGSSDGHFFQAVDLQSGEERWRFNTKSNVWSSPAIAADVVYFGTSAGEIFALQSQTGAEIWSFKAGNIIWSSPVLEDGVVYFGCDDGYLYALAGDSLAMENIAQQKAVYWDENLGFQDADRVRDFFQREDYQVLDSKTLAVFMADRIADKTPSVIVFAVGMVPETVKTLDSEVMLIRRYLDSGGKIVWLGNFNPLAYSLEVDSSGNKKFIPHYSLTEKVLGVKHVSNLPSAAHGGYIGFQVTQEGTRWGLRGWSSGCCGVEAASVSTVLALDEHGRAAAWAKNYGGPYGMGMVRRWRKPSIGPEYLAEIKAVAEYGLR